MSTSSERSAQPRVVGVEAPFATPAAGSRRHGDGRWPAPVEWALVAAMTILPWLPWSVWLAAVVVVGCLVPGTHALLIWSAYPVAAIVRGRSVPGRAVSAAEEPDLHALVCEVANRLGISGPVLVHVVPTPEAMVCQPPRSWRSPHRRSGHALVLGLPLLERLTTGQLAALVAHELAHVSNDGSTFADRRGGRLCRARDGLVASIGRPWRPAWSVCGPLLRATQPWSWRVELDADATAASVAGTRAVREVLAVWRLLDSVFGSYVPEWVDVLAKSHTYPVDLYLAVAAVLTDPIALRRVESVAEVEDLLAAAVVPAGLSGHPPTPARIATLASSSLPAEPPSPLSTVPEPNRPLTLYNGTTLRAWASRARSGPDRKSVV